MNSDIKHYIDGLIRTKAYEIKPNTGYTLYVDDLYKHQQDFALTFLLNNSETAKSLLLDYLQKLIDERLDRVYAEDKRNQGCIPVMDKVNGEITWRSH
jgi:hypothetical protein